MMFYEVRSSYIYILYIVAHIYRRTAILNPYPNNLFSKLKRAALAFIFLTRTQSCYKKILHTHIHIFVYSFIKITLLYKIL